MEAILADRLSTYEGDPGHAAYEALGESRYRVRIMLDGVEQKGVVTADRAQGWLRRFVLEDGRLIFGSNQAKTEVVKGKVEFELGPRRQPVR